MKNIFVGNLSFNASEVELRSMFEEFGSVGRVSIATDRDTGQPRGFAFVEMSDNAAGDRAIAAVNGHEVGGRALRSLLTTRRCITFTWLVMASTRWRNYGILLIRKSCFRLIFTE